MGKQINDGPWAEMKQSNEKAEQINEKAERINKKAERITAINVLTLVLNIAIFMMGK